MAMQEYYVITGASSGIGYALCRRLAQRGKAVIAVARRAKHLAVLQQEYPEFITPLAADLASESGRETVINFVNDKDQISGLVNNAATNEPLSLLQDFPLHLWRQQIAINLDAPIFLTQGLLPYLKGGRIINISTSTTNVVASGVAGYAMNKAALNTFSKYLSDELRSDGIWEHGTSFFNSYMLRLTKQSEECLIDTHIWQ